MDNLIFLDLDGVMITTKSWQSDIILADGFAEFNHNSVKKLNELLIETGYDIVLSSARRYSNTLEEMNEFFKTRGILGHIIDFIPLYDLNERYSRYQEIMKYVMKHRPENYLVLDDDRSLGSFGDRFIKTDPMIGYNGRS